MLLLCNYISRGSYDNYLAIRKAEKYVSKRGHLQLPLLASIGQVTKHTIDHFTVVCSVTWPLNGVEAGGDLVLIQTSLLLICKSSCCNAN